MSASPSIRRLCALIIGIDRYKDSSLRLIGAVADADAVMNCLVESGADKDRIIMLKNEDASRLRILDILNKLGDEEETSICNISVAKEDPILVFYAGHGGQAKLDSQNPKYQALLSHGTMQMLLPHDFIKGRSESTDAQGILDVLIQKLLRRISINKSDNLTFIADCCYSGSIDRADDGVRGVELGEDYAIPEYVAEQALNSEPSYDPRHAGGSSKDNGSGDYIMLAACRGDEKARETAQGGDFTVELMKIVKNRIVNFTYSHVINNISLDKQQPRLFCSVKHQDRLFFNTKLGSAAKYHFISSPSNGSNTFTINAGTANNITEKSEFNVYSDSTMSSIIGSVVVQSANANTCECASMEPHFTLPDPSVAYYAVQTSSGKEQNIQIYIEGGDSLRRDFQGLVDQVRSSTGNIRSFQLVKREEKHDFAISARNGMIEFQITDRLCCDCGIKRMSFDGIRVANFSESKAYLVSVLRNATNFYWNLNHSNHSPVHDCLKLHASLECFKLTSSGLPSASCFEEIFVPQDPTGGNLIDGEFLYIDTSEDLKYGYKIANNSPVPLFVSLFHFDPSNLSIDMYWPKGHPDSLQPGKFVTIGYGDGDHGRPLEFFLNEDQNTDIGFLKLYISTHFLDLSGIAQDKPHRVQRESEPKIMEMWSALTIPVIQGKGINKVLMFK